MSAAAAVLIYLLLKENNHETVQNVQIVQSQTVQPLGFADSQKKCQPQPDEGRNPSMTHDLLLSGHRL